jgi:predicted alpha/beta hydrolase family esterase
MAWVAGWAPIPMKRLPFASILAASSDDVMCSMPRSKAFAQAWGSRFIDMGAAGHIDDKTGYGAWNEVEPLLASLLP